MSWREGKCINAELSPGCWLPGVERKVDENSGSGVNAWLLCPAGVGTKGDGQAGAIPQPHLQNRWLFPIKSRIPIPELANESHEPATLAVSVVEYHMFKREGLSLSLCTWAAVGTISHLGVKNRIRDPVPNFREPLVYFPVAFLMCLHFKLVALSQCGSKKLCHVVQTLYSDLFVSHAGKGLCLVCSTWIRSQFCPMLTTLIKVECCN